jgi:thermitase
VAATDQNDGKASYSNYGSYDRVAAPGGDGSPNPGGILSCYKNSSYAWAEGTSMATPYVSGVAALVASLYPDRSNDELMRLIEETVDDIGSTGKDDYFGYGRINASGAVTASIVNEEESDSDASYTGSWAAASSGYASDGAYRYSGEVGDSVTYTFNGTGITWVADQSPESGIASVEIDGDYNEDVDLYSATSDYQSLVFAKHGLAPGTHTITITVTGNKNGNSAGTTVNVDAFDVDSSSDVTPPEDTTPPSVSISSPANNSTINNATPVLSHAVDEEVS